MHLNTRYLSDTEQKKLVLAIRNADLTVKTNSYDFPTSIHQTTVLYSPLIKDKQAVDKLTRVLNQLGWEVPGIQPFVANNQWFTKNSLGLFLLPEGIEQGRLKASRDISRRYTALNCGNLLSLKLKTNGEYQFVFDSNENGEHRYAKGLWKVTQFPFIELVTKDNVWWFYFEVLQYREVDQIGEIEVTRLVPVNNYFGAQNCRIEFGLRA